VPDICNVYGVRPSTGYVKHGCRCAKCREWKRDSHVRGRYGADEAAARREQRARQIEERRAEVAAVRLQRRAPVYDPAQHVISAGVTFDPRQPRGAFLATTSLATLLGPAVAPVMRRGASGRPGGRGAPVVAPVPGPGRAKGPATVECRLACGHRVRVTEEQARGPWVLCGGCQQAIGISEVVSALQPEPYGRAIDPNWPRVGVVPAGAYVGPVAGPPVAVADKRRRRAG